MNDKMIVVKLGPDSYEVETVDAEPLPEVHDVPSTYATWDELAEAIRQGVNNIE